MSTLLFFGYGGENFSHYFEFTINILTFFSGQLWGLSVLQLRSLWMYSCFGMPIHQSASQHVSALPWHSGPFGPPHTLAWLGPKSGWFPSVSQPNPPELGGTFECWSSSWSTSTGPAWLWLCGTPTGGSPSSLTCLGRAWSKLTIGDQHILLFSLTFPAKEIEITLN